MRPISEELDTDRRRTICFAPFPSDTVSPKSLQVTSITAAIPSEPPPPPPLITSKLDYACVMDITAYPHTTPCKLSHRAPSFGFPCPFFGSSIRCTKSRTRGGSALKPCKARFNHRCGDDVEPWRGYSAPLPRTLAETLQVTNESVVGMVFQHKISSRTACEFFLLSEECMPRMDLSLSVSLSLSLFSGARQCPSGIRRSGGRRRVPH